MTLTIGNFEIDVKRLSITVSKNSANNWVNRLTIELVDTVVADYAETANAITTALQTNDIVITNGADTYRFTEYDFEGIDRQLDADTDRTVLNFVQ